MSEDFPTPEGLEVADGDDRPGEPLYPGENTIVDRENEPTFEGEELQVWLKAYADGHGTETVTGRVQVIQAEHREKENAGDVFAIPAHQSPTEPSRVYRISADLSTITAGVLVPRPRYDAEAGVLNITRHVERRGHRSHDLLEVRTHGRQEYWCSEGSVL